MPHNYYVGTLVKLGASGLAGYLLTVLLLTVRLYGVLIVKPLSPFELIVLVWTLSVTEGESVESAFVVV